ncbi:hypothetical protein OIV83_005268 [Microbotryomycetes sp. JL201]|nr:hypothetical protein OIV83_005268 [Microbotryomycetes sp. JL201]
MHHKRRASLSPSSPWSSSSSSEEAEVRVQTRVKQHDSSGRRKRTVIERDGVANTVATGAAPERKPHLHTLSQPSPSALPLHQIGARTDSLSSDVQELSVFNLVKICAALLDNRPLVDLAVCQALAPHGRLTSNSAFGAMAKLVNGDSLPRINSSGIASIARELGMYDSENASSSSSSFVNALEPPKAILSRRTECMQCQAPLSVISSATSSVWLVDNGSLKRATLIKLACSSVSGCGAIHSPDKVEIRVQRQRLWIYDSDCQDLRVGRQVYATRALAETFTVMLESHYVPASGFATALNRLHRTSATAAEDKDFHLTSKNVWKAFVLHSILQKSKALGRPLICPADSSTSDIVQVALDDLMSSKVIDEALEHKCPECCRYKRYWRNKVVADGTSKLTTGKQKPHAAKIGQSLHKFKQQKRHVAVDSIDEDMSECASDSTVSYDMSSPAKRNRLKRLQSRQVAGIQLLVYACGTVLAWHKLETDEQASEVLSFLDKVDEQTKGTLPKIVAYDSSCKLLAHIADRSTRDPHSSSSSSSSSTSSENDSVPNWLGRTKLIVDAFHFTTHSKDDILCRTMCDPAPLDGSQPDLVTPFKTILSSTQSKSDRTTNVSSRIEFRRAFNTSAAEQLNSWLRGFATLLTTMSADNHDFMLQVLLERRVASRMQTLKDRYGDQTVG